MILERHLVFFKIDETDKTVIISAIEDGRREYRNFNKKYKKAFSLTWMLFCQVKKGRA